jgi:hypothetical protein
MELSILYRGFSQEDTQAEEVLRNGNINFVEVFSDENNHFPVFCAKGSTYTYEGLNEIIDYVNFRQEVCNQ